ncbi:hypothetical protein [Methanoregula sp.]|uniref:hypothetical protein n=1 Tax=Methanoregula sp. TaxID=2052170 RepID=UPI003BB13979
MGTNTYIKKLVDPDLPYVSESANTVVGAVIGGCIAGPIGAGVGAVGGKLVEDLFTRAGMEIDKRYLSHRESARIGIAAAYAITRIDINQKSNLQLRTDNFFIKDKITERSVADEILEGTLLAAKNEYEEKKLKYYGNLVANIAFHSDIDHYHSNYLLRIGERLSYRQLCILDLFKFKSHYQLSQNVSFLFKKLTQNEMVIFREIEELKILNLLGSSNESLMGGNAAGNLTPALLELTETGKVLHSLMNLDEIDKFEIDSIAVKLEI